jgi:alkanesulfonate monooxygenase SsuD/methylene tetrahydromethanopterin reductase-like flavin-dependent oxidoreductase (luciferase family)
VLIAARVAPATRHIGFVPTAITTHTEPFHLSKAIATLDYVSAGRAGIRVQVATRAGTTAHFGRREIPPLELDRLTDPDTQRLIADHFDEAADYVEVLRRLWTAGKTTRKSATSPPAASSTGTSCTTSTSRAAGSP